MARVFKAQEAEELNLTPIMNMVLVLIPLMLLSVVFMQIAMIDVTMPQRSAGGAANDGEPPKRLQLFISRQGFTVLDGVAAMPAIEGCPGSGVTVCASMPDAPLEVDRHNWVALYNLLIDLKNSSEDWSKHETIEIVADPNIPYGVLVKAMDITRYQLIPAADVDTGALRGKRFADNDEMNEAVMVSKTIVTEEGEGTVGVEMFPLVVLGLPLTQ